MRPIGIISTTALFLLLGFPAAANARQEKQEEKDKPAKQEPQAKPEKQQAKGQQEQQHKQQQQQAKSQQDQQRQQQRRQQDDSAKQQQKQDKSAKQEQQQQAKGQQDQQRQQRQQHQQQTASSQRPQRSQQEEARQREQPALRLSERGSGRIPDERFRSNFGHEHRFRIGDPVLVGGYSRFQYGGYWFGFVEPWPDGWYYNDDVYIDYVDGGYYMYNPYYPGARFAIIVVI